MLFCDIRCMGHLNERLTGFCYMGTTRGRRTAFVLSRLVIDGVGMRWYCERIED